jgi:hypothetical protein
MTNLQNKPAKTNHASSAEPVVPSVANLPTLHIVNSLDGGAGKSMLSRILCAYYINKAVVHRLLDADPKLDVAIAYNPELHKKWSGGMSTEYNFMAESLMVEDEQNDLLSEQIIISRDDALYFLGEKLMMVAAQMDTVLCLPANNHEDLRFWLDDNSINLRNDLSFRPVSWWLSNGSIDNQKAFVKFVDDYPNIDHVFAPNLGIKCASSHWKRFSVEPEVREVIKTGKVKLAQVELFKSDPKILERVAQGERFDTVTATLHKDIATKVTGWLENNWSNLSTTGYLPKK